jgi:hypothetical protein
MQSSTPVALDPQSEPQPQPSRKQLRRTAADKVAQQRGALPDARTYFHSVQTLKVGHLFRTAFAAEAAKSTPTDTQENTK